MMVHVLTGWQQPASELAACVPDANIFEYQHYRNLSETYQALKKENPEYLLGWSLGGLLAASAFASGHVHPKKLVLISTPFQFTQSDTVSEAMPNEQFKTFSKSYQDNPHTALSYFARLMAHGDSNAKQIIQKQKQESIDIWESGNMWLQQLEKTHLHMADLGKTRLLLIHGECDEVVSAKQMDMIAALGDDVQTQMWPDCGHAPHLHNQEKLTRQLTDFFHS